MCFWDEEKTLVRICARPHSPTCIVRYFVAGDDRYSLYLRVHNRIILTAYQLACDVFRCIFGWSLWAQSIFGMRLSSVTVLCILWYEKWRFGDKWRQIKVIKFHIKRPEQLRLQLGILSILCGWRLIRSIFRKTQFWMIKEYVVLGYVKWHNL